MLRRDFLMVQIEELGKVIAQIISQRNAVAARHIPEQIRQVYDALNVNTGFLMSTSPDDIRRFLDKEDSGGILRMEIAIKLMIEESFLLPDRQQDMLLKAKELLEYLQATDKTFSLERIRQLQELDELLSGFNS